MMIDISSNMPDPDFAQISLFLTFERNWSEIDANRKEPGATASARKEPRAASAPSFYLPIDQEVRRDQHEECAEPAAHGTAEKERKQRHFQDNAQNDEDRGR